MSRLPVLNYETNDLILSGRIRTAGNLGVVADYAYHVPNGIWIPGDARASAKIIASLKKQGFRTGVSDIVIALPVAPYHGAYIELKRDKKSEVREDQVKWLNLMSDVGYYTDIAIGLEQAIWTTQNYLTGQPAPPRQRS